MAFVLCVPPILRHKREGDLQFHSLMSVNAGKLI